MDSYYICLQIHHGHRHNHHRFLLWQLQLTRQLKELWLKVNTRQISSQSKQQISSDIIKDSPKTKTKTPRKSITAHCCYCPLCKTVSVTVKSWSKQTTIVFHCCVSVVVPIQGLDSKILFCFREWSVWKLPSGWTKNLNIASCSLLDLSQFYLRNAIIDTVNVVVSCNGYLWVKL